MKRFFSLLLPLIMVCAAARHWEIVETKGSAHYRHEHAFVKIKDQFLILGGRRIQPVDLYDPATKTWTKGKRPPIELHHFQALEHEGRVLIAGAFTGKYPAETPVDRIHFYDPTNDRWTKGPVIPEERRRGSAGAFLREGKLYLVCGLTDGHRSGWVTWFDEYDFKTKQWRKLPDAPRSRDHFQAALAGDQLVLVGGRRSGEGGNVFKPVINEVDIFDFKTNKWKTLPDHLPVPRAGTSSLVLDGKVLVIGGESGRDEAHTEVHALDPLTGKWSELPSLDIGRHATQPILHEGSLYLGAGSITRGGTETNSLLKLPLDR